MREKQPILPTNTPDHPLTRQVPRQRRRRARHRHPDARQMAEPSEWHITVLNEDAVNDAWYEEEGMPDTGVLVGSGGGTR